MGGEATPDQTPMSQPPQSSPFSPHPFWSEKAKAEAELAQARPSSLDDAAKKTGIINATEATRVGCEA